MQQDIYLKNSEELPVPDVTSFCELDSDSANITHAGLIHIFKLPRIGEYNWNFRLWSNAVILNGFKTNQIQIARNGMSVDPGNVFLCDSIGIIHPYSSQDIYEVDCILNYIESVSLCIDSPEEILSKITNIPRIHQLQRDIKPILGVDLEFLNLPLLTASLHNSDIYVVIKFVQKPSIKYYLNFEVGFVVDETIQKQLKNCEISIPAVIVNEGSSNYYTLKYTNGNLMVQ